MNKAQLVDALAARIGDRRIAATAVDGLLETIVDTVGAGESVTLTGFGVFESRARAARVARNPRTGETVDVPATTVPAFRPGTGFRTAVGGAGAPRTTPVHRPRAAVAGANAEPTAAATVEPETPSVPAKQARTESVPVTVPAEKRPAEKRPAEKRPAAKSPAESSNWPARKAKVTAPFAAQAPTPKSAKGAKPAAKPEKSKKSKSKK